MMAPSMLLPCPIPTSGRPSFLFWQGHQELVAILNPAEREELGLELDAGYHEIMLNIANLTTGVYFYKIEADGFVDVKKLAIVK